MLERSARSETSMTTPTPTDRPTLVACPACGVLFAWPAAGRCGACGADLASAEARHVWDLDRRIATLTEERWEAVDRLAATRPPAPAPVRSGEGVSLADLAPPAGPPLDSTGGRSRGPIGVPTLLGLAGAALLTAAAAVFTAVAWALLPLAVKALLLVAATAAAAVGGIQLHRRDVPVAGASLGLLAMALVAVDVAGAERAGLLIAEELVPGIALLGAAAMGAWLTTTSLRWVGPVAALALPLGAFATTTGIVALADLGPVGGALVATGASVALVGSGRVWPEHTGRVLHPIAGVVGLTIAGLVAVGAVAAADPSIAAGLAVAAVPTALLAAGARRSVWLWMPVTLVVTLAAPAVTAALPTADTLVIGTAAAAAAAAAAWVAMSVPSADRTPVLLGAWPALAVTFPALGELGRSAALRLADGYVGPLPGLTLDSGPADPWLVAVAGVLALGLLAWPAVQRRPGIWLTGTAIALSPTVPAPGPWLLLLVVAAVAAALAREGVDAVTAVGAGVVAVVWAGADPTAVAVTSAVTAGTAGAVHPRTTEHAYASLTVVVTGLLALGVAAGAALTVADVGVAWAVGAGASVVAAAAAGIRATDPTTGVAVGAPLTLAVTTLVAPLAAPSPRAAGVVLLLLAVGWLLQGLLGASWARWVAASAASLGNAVLLADADVALVEAYTVVPAVLLGAVGVAWLHEDRTVGTPAALWPALSVGLVPSLLRLSGDPRHLGRALALTAAVALLAAAGARLRWRAPIAAAGAAGVWVALTQLAIVLDVVPRWIVFGLAGALLVWLAATYERQQARVVGVGRRLLTLR
jgi:hypothetical protein